MKLMSWVWKLFFGEDITDEPSLKSKGYICIEKGRLTVHTDEPPPKLPPPPGKWER